MNDRVKVNGRVYALLHCEPESDKAWAIDINDDKAWPRVFAWSRLCKLQPLSGKAIVALKDETDNDKPSFSGDSSSPRTLSPTPAMIKVRDRALKLLGDLINPNKSYPQIFDMSARGEMVFNRAQEAGCSTTTIYKHLRRWWTGGQTPSALLGNYPRCSSSVAGGTRGRGAKPEFERRVYQLTPGDFANFKKYIERHYLKGKLKTMAFTFQKLLEGRYARPDGNGDEYLLAEGERPTFKQFQYFLHKTYPAVFLAKKREGEKEYAMDHKEVLGTVMDVCHGVGHIYEADASIADIYLIASDDISKIIGKPTIYLIIDRKSRLIVGWYVGMENASWTVVMQAFASISQDKEAICKRLGIAYRASDWPAHQVFPKQVLGDKGGELNNKTKCQLTSEFHIDVASLPAKCPQWKPVVETEFKQTRAILQPSAPGFDPPENAKKRQGKHYDKDACWTISQFEKVIVAAIIAHNRKPLLKYPLTLKEIGNNVAPVPIDLWNHDIVERAGLLPRYDETRVRMALLPRDKASVSEQGILFNDCQYSCSEGIAKGWFASARVRRFTLEVAYDRRLVDTIYAFDPDKSGRMYECRLTTRSDRYKGLSFSEVYAIEKMQRRNAPGYVHAIAQANADFHKVSDAETRAGKNALKDANLSKSRGARRVDTKNARAAELRKERQARAPINLTPINQSTAKKSGTIVSLDAARPQAVEMKASGVEIQSPPRQTHEDKIKAMKERMLSGKL